MIVGSAGNAVVVAEFVLFFPEILHKSSRAIHQCPTHETTIQDELSGC